MEVSVWRGTPEKTGRWFRRGAGTTWSRKSYGETERVDAICVRDSRLTRRGTTHSRDLSGRGAARAEDAQGTPTQSHISPSILVYEDTIRVEVCGSGEARGRLGAGSRMGRPSVLTRSVSGVHVNTRPRGELDRLLQE